MASSDAARRYARIRYRLMLIELVGWVGFLGTYQASGFSGATAHWVSTVTTMEALRVGGYVAVFGACAYLVFFPIHLYGGLLLEHRFDLSRLSLKGWLVREAKQLAVSAVLGLLLVESLYAVLRHVPTRWPVLAAMGWVGFSVVLARIFPTWLLPIFYKTSPVGDASLAQRLLALCERARLSALGVFRVDLGVETRKANAALAGFGRTRRVLVSDTLLERFSPEEIETVLAHELGHQRHRHIAKFLVLSGLGSLLAFMIVDRVSGVWLKPFGLQGLADIAGFPLVMLVLALIGLAGLPLQNGISRYFEWQADRFAVRLTQRPSAFGGALRKLGELNLADPDPPRWVVWLFYDHPPLPQRIAAAEQS